jgi:hypothetical protein
VLGKADFQERCEIVDAVERLTGKTLTVSLLEANLLEESEGWHLEWSQPRTD